MQHQRKPEIQHSVSPLARSILMHLRQPGHRPQTVPELERRFPKKQRKSVSSALADLEHAGLIRKVRGGHAYLIAKGKKNYQGRLSLHPRGFGFVRCDDLPDSDVMIPSRFIGTALDGDLVSFSLLPSEGGIDDGPFGDSRLSGRINQILERGDHRITGILRKDGHVWWLMPSPNRQDLPAIRLSPEDGKDAFEFEVGEPIDGAWGMCNVVDWDATQKRAPVGRLTGVFPKDVLEKSPYFLIEARHGIAREFPEAVTSEAQALANREAPEEPPLIRKDMRHINTFTIDPTEAGDFDDAISLEVLESGNWLVGVHIADVSHFVQPDSALDREAFSRANSFYLPGKMIPMFPKILCQDLLSLRPQEDRRTISVLLEYTPPPNSVLCGTSFHLSLIRSDARLTYSQVQAWLEGKSAPPHPGLETDVFRTERLAQDLRAQRMAHGAIDLDVPELEVVVDHTFKPIDVVLSQTDRSHQMIEEMMLAANKAVADYLQDHHVPTLFRVHDPPPADRIQRLNREVAELGLSSGRLRHRSDIQRLVDRHVGTPMENILRFHVLRAMSRALYAPEVREHYGLAEGRYLHFTSPIRRYADLVVHRSLREAMGWPFGQVRDPITLANTAVHLIDQEGHAQEAEREASRLLTLQLLDRRRRNGELKELDAVIRAVHPGGIFLELNEFLLTAGIDPSDLRRSGYKYSRKMRCYQSGRGKRALFTGGRLKVRIKRVDMENQELWVVPVEENLDEDSGPERQKADGGRKGRIRKPRMKADRPRKKRRAHFLKCA
jgi:ribonuclease R